MNNKNGKWLLAVVALCCLTPAAFAHHRGDGGWGGNGCGCDQRWNCKTVPEGGSAAIYVLGAGLTCAGAMFLRSRVAKPTQS